MIVCVLVGREREGGGRGAGRGDRGGQLLEGPERMGLDMKANSGHTHWAMTGA